MLSSTVLAIFFASLVSASPAPVNQIVSVPLTTFTKPGANSLDILASDRARKAFKENKEKRQTTVPVTNGVVSYLAPVKFGGSSTTYNLIVDTGSSNTWAGSYQSFTCSSPCQRSGTFSLSYGSGSVSGNAGTDTVTIGSLSVTGQWIGAATQSTGFDGVDGILGVGPEDLTQGTFSSVSEAPTVVQNAASQGKIPKTLLGVYFAPNTNGNNVQNGELDFGGIDTAKTTSSVTYISVGGSGSEYWGISVPITVGSTSAGTQSCIVDTGTTLIYLPSSVYNTWLKAIPSAVVDSNSGLVRFPKSSLSSVPSIALTVGGVKYSLNNYAQLVEQALYSDFGLSSSYYYSWVYNGGSSGLSCIIGQKYLERFYSVYDTDNNRVGFATTSNSNPTSVP